ncbi:unnamed protein product [Rotaria sordida]|uniref:EF-hand domain-containing protein n=1 Tax=Rotaria sordida TaxID=392033 RepID=A0A813RSL3_9BILA|nr:unnamed protein product [Rotaria sordida]CAF0785844.1 unnamed protein product [Rotaria sordida]CAF0786922.1 unnamed protein product [Rotaria sordida]CAF0831136.1 unnamed protein product [Rotaria sordida]CAF0875632.1 unnamed protein product [Rotaria sordida]
MSTAKSSSTDLRSEFDRLDCDKDGFITIQEFRAYYAQKNTDQSTIEKAFAEIDADKDGLVTFEEFQRAYKQ